MRFGRHKGEPLAVVRDEDPGYFSWAVREVDGFAEVARKAGLLDGEDES